MLDRSLVQIFLYRTQFRSYHNSLLLLLLHRLYLVGNLFPKRINWQWKSPPMFVHRVGPCRNCRLLLRVGWEQLISPVYELNLS